MSLLITSSTQPQYHKSGQDTVLGLEDPASYTNFLKSPLIIDKNSEIAVVSLKIETVQDKICLKEGDGLLLFWGYEYNDTTQGNRQDPDGSGNDLGGVNRTLKIELTNEDRCYTREEFTIELKKKLDEVVLKAWCEVQTITVTDNYSAGTFVGYTITFKQWGSGASFSNAPAVAEFDAYIRYAGQTADASTRISIDELQNTLMLDTQATDVFTATASGTGIKISGSRTPGEAFGGVCDVIGQAHPLSRVNGSMVVHFDVSNTALNLEDRYIIGLVRNMGSNYVKGGQEKFFTYAIPIGNYEATGNETGLEAVPVSNDISYGSGSTPIDYVTYNVPIFFDYAFMWFKGSDPQLIQAVTNDAGERIGMELVGTAGAYETAVTNASILDKTYDRVKFELSGESVYCSIGLTGKSTYEPLLSAATTTYADRFAPIGMHTDALYPKFHIGLRSDTVPGNVWMETYTGHTKTGFFENNYWGYGDRPVIGEDDDGYPAQEYLTVYNELQNSQVYRDGKDVAGNTYGYRGLLGGGVGVDNKWTLLFTADTTYLTETESQYLQGFDMTATQQFLGYNGIDIVRESEHATNPGTAEVSFISAVAPEEKNFNTNNMFIRFKNHALNSYNANKNSISNIVYGCPQFDVRGNDNGVLYYEPSERVYVKFNNTVPVHLNSVNIDLVDVDEKLIDGLKGRTVVQFHIRKASTELNRT